MADLIAQGGDPQNRWRRTLAPGQVVVLGRSSTTWSVPWDKKISRQHAELRCEGASMVVRRLPSGRNAIYYRGQDEPEFVIHPGEQFVIGETTFTLADNRAQLADDSPAPLEQRAYDRSDLQAIRYRNAEERIDVLSRLPSVISGATDEGELFVRLSNMLLTGVPDADAIAFVGVENAARARPLVRLLHWDRRLALRGDFRPSERLILESARRNQTVSHIWTGESPSEAEFTQAANLDWAFCTPVPGDQAERLCLYITGRSDHPYVPRSGLNASLDLSEHLKFTELVAAILGSLRQVRQLQRKQAVLSQCFSPVVIQALGDDDPDVALAPRLADVTVLFCDLRGFSRESERNAHDLMGLLERVSKALRIMTYHILDSGGVVGDFQGDAAMGFWGWPISQPDAVLRACTAALGIRTQFEANAHRDGHPLTDFKIGIGIASGQAVAGKIGTIDQAKVSVFGPVVNLASRLEGMTKLLYAPILLDDATAAKAREQLPAGAARLRRVAVVKPYGMDRAQPVVELLPPCGETSTLADEHIACYESALDALHAGRWSETLALLARIPPEDQVKDFLTVFIAQHNRTPPPGWDGVIAMTQKQ